MGKPREMFELNPDLPGTLSHYIVDNRAALKARGAFDIESKDNLIYKTDLLISRKSEYETVVMFDLKEVSFLGRIALKEIQSMRRRLLNEADKELHLYAPSNVVHRMLEVSKLLDNFVIVEAEDQEAWWDNPDFLAE